MSYYRICPECGAALDPGEMCDCKESHVHFAFAQLTPDNQARVNRRISALYAEQNAGREFARPRV